MAMIFTVNPLLLLLNLQISMILNLLIPQLSLILQQILITKLRNHQQTFLAQVVSLDVEMKGMFVNVKELFGSSQMTKSILLTLLNCQMEEAANKKLMDRFLALVKLLEIQLQGF